MMGSLFFVAALCFGLVASKPYDPQNAHSDGFDPLYPEENPGLFEGDIILDKFDPYNAVGTEKRKWPGGKIPVSIHSYFDKYDVKLFIDIMRTIEDQTRGADGKDCVTFYNQTNEDAYVYVTTGRGCSSIVGYSGGPQPVTLAPLCRFKGTAMHEFLHALGFYHEQNRPDRDDYVKVIKDHIKPGHAHNFVKLFPPMISLQNLPYDYHSLTHYAKDTFAIDRSKPTIIGLKKGAEFGQREGMSQMDIKQVQRLYGCQEREIIKTQTPGLVTINCTFDADICGWTHIDIQPPLKKNNWTRWHGESENWHSGPEVDHTIKTFEGYYIFLNAFKNYNSVAKIQSPEIDSGDHCLTFWYHMFGRDMGTLTVNLVKNGMAYKLTSLTGEQGNEWKQMKVFVQAPTGGKIEFEGLAGDMYRSDMAIDDVLLLPGKCP